MLAAARTAHARRGDRRRPAGLEAAWGLKQRGMSVALVHLMPTLMERQLDAAAGQLLQRDLDRRGIAFFTNGQTEEILGTERAEGVQLADGRFDPGRSGGAGHRHPAQHRAGQGGRAGSQPRHRGHRRHAHQRSGYLRRRRMRRASRPGVRPGRPDLGSGQGVRGAARRRRDRGVRQPGPRHQPQDHRHRRVLGRRADGGGPERRRDHAARRRLRALQEDRAARRPAGRRGALRRCRRRAVVSAVDARQARTSARCASGWCSAAPSPMPAPARRRRPTVRPCRTTRRSAAATASRKGDDRRARSATRSSPRWPRSAPTPRRRRPAANAPRRSRGCSRFAAGADARADREDAVRMHRCRPRRNSPRHHRATAQDHGRRARRLRLEDSPRAATNAGRR